MAERTATSRLARLLALVPYILTHQGVTFAEASKEFGISEAQLRDDLDLIFVSGLPGYSHLELIDVVMDHDSIYIRNADVISKPMRLSTDEALSLLVGLELLESISPNEVATLKAKISQTALMPLEKLSERFMVLSDRSEAGELIQDALTKGRRLLLEYYVPSRDEISVREVDPLRIEVIDGHTYLVAYCRLAENFRHFKVDRIVSAKIVDRPSSPPQDSGAPGWSFSALAVDEVVLEIDQASRWLIDYLGASVIKHEPLTICASMADPEFFIRLGLSMAQQITVQSPESLRDEIALRARAALDSYSGDSYSG